VAVSGIKQRVRGAKFQEHYNQATLFFNSMSPYEKKHIIEALSFELDHCDDPLVYENYSKILNNIDHNLAITVAQNVGGALPEKLPKENHRQISKPLSQLYYAPKTPTIVSRRIAILVGDGFDAGVTGGLKAAFMAAGAVPFLIGPRRNKIASSGGLSSGLFADHHYEGQRSTMFDALIIAPGEKSSETMRNSGRVIHWVREAFGHLKAIGAIGDGTCSCSGCRYVFLT